MKAKISNDSDVGLVRGNVFVDANSTTDEVEVDEHDVALIESHPSLSVEIVEEGENAATQEGLEDSEKLPEFEGEQVGDSSGDPKDQAAEQSDDAGQASGDDANVGQ